MIPQIVQRNKTVRPSLVGFRKNSCISGVVHPPKITEIKNSCQTVTGICSRSTVVYHGITYRLPITIQQMSTHLFFTDQNRLGNKITRIKQGIGILQPGIQPSIFIFNDIQPMHPGCIHRFELFREYSVHKSLRQINIAQ